MKKAAIQFTYLKYFYDAVMFKSMSAAARENFVSQSAISQGIAKLEIALQVKLITDQRHKFSLTEEGEIVFSETKRLLEALDGLQEKLGALKGEVLGEVKFMCTNSLAQFYLPTAYLQMKRHYPKVKLTFHRGGLNAIHEGLRKERVRFALVLDAPEFDGYQTEPLSTGCFRLYKLKGVKKASGLVIDHLENQEVIELKIRYKERYAKELEVLEAVSGWGLVLAFIQQGYGIGYLPEFIGGQSKELQEVKIDIAPIHYSISAVSLKGTVMTRAEKAFLDILKAEKRGRAF